MRHRVCRAPVQIFGSLSKVLHDAVSHIWMVQELLDGIEPQPTSVQLWHATRKVTL